MPGGGASLEAFAAPVEARVAPNVRETALPKASARRGQALAERLQVSPPPIKAALAVPKRRRVLERVPNPGSVRAPSERDVAPHIT